MNRIRSKLRKFITKGDGAVIIIIMGIMVLLGIYDLVYHWFHVN